MLSELATDALIYCVHPGDGEEGGGKNHHIMGDCIDLVLYFQQHANNGVGVKNLKNCADVI